MRESDKEFYTRKHDEACARDDYQLADYYSAQLKEHDMTRRQFLLFDFKDEMRKIHNDWCLANDLEQAQIKPRSVEDDIDAEQKLTDRVYFATIGAKDE